MLNSSESDLSFCRVYVCDVLGFVLSRRLSIVLHAWLGVELIRMPCTDVLYPYGRSDDLCIYFYNLRVNNLRLIANVNHNSDQRESCVDNIYI